MQFCISALHFWPCTFSFTGFLLCLLCKLAARKITCFWHLHGTWVLWENFGCPPTTYLGSNSRPRTNCAITCRRYSILIWCPQLPSPICVFCFFLLVPLLPAGEYQMKQVVIFRVCLVWLCCLDSRLLSLPLFLALTRPQLTAGCTPSLFYSLFVSLSLFAKVQCKWGIWYGGCGG